MDEDKIDEIKQQLKQQLIADGWTPPGVLATVDQVIAVVLMLAVIVCFLN